MARPRRRAVAGVLHQHDVVDRHSLRVRCTECGWAGRLAFAVVEALMRDDRSLAGYCRC
jgi:hypothetical protein